jgi:ribosomal protein S18 acetylase RimI-like enzyme
MTPGNIAISTLTLRLATAEDTAFLQELFASTRDEFKKLITDESQLAALMNMQFSFQRQQYQEGYPDGQDQIIISNDRPVGRLFTSEDERTITLVDIALLLEYRGQGIGRQLVDDLLARARRVNKTVVLHVLKTNRARNLYDRLGFRIAGEDSMYYEMIREPQAMVT